MAMRRPVSGQGAGGDADAVLWHTDERGRERLYQGVWALIMVAGPIMYRQIPLD